MSNSIKKTGNGTAVLRNIETSKRNALIIDKYATFFTNKEGQNWVNSLTEDTRNLMIDMIAVRTKIIDKYLINFATGKYPCDGKISFDLNNNREASQSLNTIKTFKDYQLVIVGSGFDTRAFRISELSNFSIFEVDYPDVLDLKETIIKKHKLQPICKKYEFVSIDLSMENMISQLLKKGFQLNIPTFWILEAISGYLTGEVNKLLFDQILSSSAIGSSLISTFIGESRKAYGNKHEKSNKHIFYTDFGSDFISGKGWSVNQKRLNEFARLYNRNNLLEDYDYWIVCAQLLTDK